MNQTSAAGQRVLLVLGGSEDQLHVYRQGRAMGLRVVGVDARADALGAAEADLFLQISTRSPEEIARAVGPLDVAAVISPASDASAPSVVWLCRHYRTPWHCSEAAVQASIDKSYFLSVVARLGLPTYRQVKGSSSAELMEAAAGLRYPLVIKPTDASGSKGTLLIREPAQLAAAVAQVWPYCFAGQAVLEEEVAGRHATAEVFLQHGKLALAAVADRWLTPPPYLITTVHRAPARLDEAVRSQLIDMLTAVCAELDYPDGPANFDFVLTAAGEIVLIEMGARLGGIGMPLLIQQAYGVNVAAAAIHLAAGEPFDVTPTRDRCVQIAILHSDVDGQLTGHGDLATVRALPGVVDVRMFYQVGARVRAYTQAANKLGYLVVAADDHTQLDQFLDRARAELALTIEPNPTD